MHFGHFYVAKAIYALLAHFCRKNDLPALSGKFLPFIFCRPESFEFLCLCYRYYVWILWMLRMLWILWILVWHNPSIKYLAEVPSKMHFVGPTRFIMPLENLLIYFFKKRKSYNIIPLYDRWWYKVTVWRWAKSTCYKSQLCHYWNLLMLKEWFRGESKSKSSINHFNVSGLWRG